MSAHDQLQARREARRLLDEAALLVGQGWCQGALALDDAGRRVEPWSESARRWSPLGALLRTWYESPGSEPVAFRLACTALSNATGGRVEEWNAAPWRTRRHVLNAFGRARSTLPAPRRNANVAPGHTEVRQPGPAAAPVGAPSEQQ